MFGKIKQFFLFWKIDRQLAFKYRYQRDEVARAYAGTIRNILRHDKQGVISRNEAYSLLEALENMD